MLSQSKTHGIDVIRKKIQFITCSLHVLYIFVAAWWLLVYGISKGISVRSLSWLKKKKTQFFRLAAKWFTSFSLWFLEMWLYHNGFCFYSKFFIIFLKYGVLLTLFSNAFEWILLNKYKHIVLLLVCFR